MKNKFLTEGKTDRLIKKKLHSVRRAENVHNVKEKRIGVFGRWCAVAALFYEEKEAQH